ncbi:hypothetical protein SCUP515_07514 [Seiridium cupressi]
MYLKQLLTSLVLVTGTMASPVPHNVTATTTPSCASTPSNDTLMARADDQWGRPGKVPYRKSPKCYVDCFDSESTDDKTWPAIGDIRDLTTYEFCHSQYTWVGTWFKEHLQFCTGSACAYCSPQCNHDAKAVFDSICPTYA